MKRNKTGFWASVLVFILLVSQVMAGFQSQTVHAANHSKADDSVKDLVIYQNLSQVDTNISGGSLQLKALNVYDEGHFKWTQDHLTWKSTNKNVATVDEDGKVTFHGKPGRTFIVVSDGNGHWDRITLHGKPDKDSEGKKDVAYQVVAQDWTKYDLVDQAVKNMSLEEKVGQMMMPDFRKWNGENVTEMLTEIEQMVKDYHLGGVILFRENVVTTEQTTQLVADYQNASERFGLLTTIDQEGGIVTRLQSGTDFPGNMALGATRSEDITYNVGQAIGEELSSLGINMNLAPVMDVNNNPDNPVIGVRSFGEDPELVAELGTSYIQGVQSTGVAATAKHFPGHGDTATDSHIGLPEVPYGIDRLEDVELYPFQQAMDAGVDAIMTAHVTFPKIDDSTATSKKTGEEVTLPATLSKKVLTGLMREKMGYDGVIYTDALNMNAITEHFGSVDAAVRAVKAGTDIVLMPVGIEKVFNGLVDAIEKGEIKEKSINASVERILELKIEKGIIKSEQPESVEKKVENAKQVVGSEAHKAVEQKAAEKSITLVKNEDVLPITNSNEKVVVVGKSFVGDLGSAVKAEHDNTDVIELGDDYALSDDQLQQIKEADYVVVGTYTYNVSTRAEDSPQMQMVDKVMEEADGSVIGVGIRNPYDIMAYPDVDTFIAQYGFRDASFEATAKVLVGENAPTGELPVTIPNTDGEGAMYDYGHGLTFDPVEGGDDEGDDEGEDEEENEQDFKLGVEQLLNEKKELIEGKKVGLITNPTGVDQDMNSIVDLLHNDEDVNLTALYGPEHGVRGSAQAGEYVEFYEDEQTGLPVYSLYGETRKPSPEMLEDVEVLLFDIQDVGTRFYTYIYTMALAMEASAENDIEFVVLDRPNPLSGEKVAGPVLDEDYKSFVGKYPIPLRHGMTVGELAKMFNKEFDIGADLTVVEMENWNRDDYYKDTGLEFVMPSPNMPTTDTALVYPGAALIEGTNVSEGRGTTKPFELIGAPYINSKELADKMGSYDLPGVDFRAASFTPSFSKHSGELVHGVELHVTNKEEYNAVETGLTLVKTIHDLYPEDFAFREENSNGVSFFDYLIGNGWVREAIENGKSVDEMQEKWQGGLEEFMDLREEYLLYQ